MQTKFFSIITLVIFGLTIFLSGCGEDEEEVENIPEEIISEIDGAEMCLIPAGEFEMGTDSSEIPELVDQYWDDSDDNEDGDKYNDPNDATDSGNNEGFSPIGNSTTQFTGSYDGQEHTIDSLFIDRESDYVGLFGLTDGAKIKDEIKDIGVTNVDVTGNDDVGGLVGRI